MSEKETILSTCTSESPSGLRQNVRQQLSSDVEQFLKNGGAVSQIADNVRADPPKKPNMQYGSAPI